MSDFNPYVEIARLVAASICGALSGAFAAHKLTARRERASGIASRKRAFLTFMRAWKRELDMVYNDYEAIYKVPDFFNQTISNFCAAAEDVRGDFTGARFTEFERLVAAISGFNPHKNKRDDYEPLIKSTEEVIAYVDAA